MATPEELKESWKHKGVFEQQLNLNVRQLQSGYPPHWKQMLEVLEHYRPKSIHELGCGVGAASEVIKRHLPFIEYSGSDYSEDAIHIAKNHWETPEKFSVLDIRDMTEDFVQRYDCILEGAVLDVMPNGDEMLEFILSLNPKNLYLQRMKFTDEPSYYEEYEAYGQITTCQYHHNMDTVFSIADKYDYDIVPIKSKPLPIVSSIHDKFPEGLFFKRK